MDDLEYDVNEPEFQQWLTLYRIYRLMSAILIHIGELFIKKKYGKGWKEYYKYEMTIGNNE